MHICLVTSSTVFIISSLILQIRTQIISNCYQFREDVSATYKVQAENLGFHKNLHFQVNVTANKTAHRKNQTFLLEQILPSSLYIDPFEPDLPAHLPYATLLPEDINTETLAEFSPEIPVLLFWPLNFTNGRANLSASLAIHVRYHKPRDLPFIEFNLPLAKLYVKTNDLINSISAPCDRTNLTSCHWCPIPITYNSSVIVFHVPVGQTRHVMPVFLITALVICLGCIYLLAILNKWKTKIKIKLK